VSPLLQQHSHLATALCSEHTTGYQIWLPGPYVKATVANLLSPFGYQFATVAKKKCLVNTELKVHKPAGDMQRIITSITTFCFFMQRGVLDIWQRPRNTSR
jgi:hypothetical protein